MRDERPRQRAAGDRLHHRRLDFEVAARVQERADRGEHAAAHLEHPPRLGIDDQIEIALAVADLDVLQPVPLLRQRHEALGQELQRRRPDRQLVGLGPEQLPLDADVVAEIEQLEDREVALGQRVLPDVDLDLARGRPRCTRKFALPKLRIARIRPAVRGLDRRRLELLAGLRRRARRPELAIVSVRSNFCGYGSTPRRTSSSKLARRWRS